MAPACRPASVPACAVVVVLPEPWSPVIRMTLGGRLALSSGLASGAAEERHHLVAHDAHDRLVGAEALQDVLADGPGAHAVDELP